MLIRRHDAVAEHFRHQGAALVVRPDSRQRISLFKPITKRENVILPDSPVGRDTGERPL
jgi:hypothetical protein